MWIIILGLLITIYILLETIIPGYGSIGSYILRPLLWISLALSTILIARQQGKNILTFKRIRHWYLGKSPIQAGFLLGGFHVSILILVGIFTSFGKSPYALTPFSILINSIYIGSMILGIELSRTYLISSLLKRRNLTSILIFITLLYVILQLSLDDYSLFSFAEPTASLQFIGNTIITAIAINLLATYLAYLGGASASIAYTSILIGFEWFSPILPTPHWTINALISTITPTIGYLILQDSLLTPREKRTLKRKQRRKESDHLDWTVVSIFSVLVIFFSFGYLGATPTVIYSGSMTPTYHVGDIVLIDEVDVETLQEGDIIQYIDFDNTSKIIHRIIEISQENNKTYYLTKGDANNAADFQPITKQRILGKPIFTIPKIGWIQIFIKSSMQTIGFPL